MIFAPFTGKDNHGKCVCFGAGLISGEDEDSYSWLLEMFLACMDNKPPSLFITDQDLGMKKAIANVLPRPGTRHRLCMWHIMVKVAEKLPVSLRANGDFSKKFNALVWSDIIDPKQFEQGWNSIMDEFDLTSHKWFSTMFDLREHWIPAYFRDVPMGGIFRTTSMSECENSFFQKYSNRHANLIEFLMHFWSAIDQQRHTHNQLTCNDVKSVPELSTKLPIEKHVASLYTFSIFKDIQIEIVAALNSCCMLNITHVAYMTTYEVDDAVGGRFTLVYSSLDQSITCGCNNFIMKGLLCRHAFFVLKNLRFDKIPDRYVLRRWSKSACFDEHYKRLANLGQYECSSTNNQLYHEFYQCIGLVHGDDKLMADMLVDLKHLTEKYSSLCTAIDDGKGKKKLMHDIYGGSIADSVSVLSPNEVKTKGSGSRIQSRRESAIKKASKAKRKCSKCKKMTNHDARNCDQAIQEDS